MREVIPFMHFDKSIPYHSPSQGPAENVIKIIRSLTSTILRVKNWPHELIPKLVEGVVQTYRAVYSSKIGTSPHNKKHGSHQDLRFMCGDQVVFKPHVPKTARKTADLLGRRGNYIRRESRQSVRVVEFAVEGVPFVMRSVHPVNVSVIRKGILSEWGYNGGDPASSPVLAGSTDTGREPEATEGEWIQHSQELEEIIVPSKSKQEQEQTSGEESKSDEGAKAPVSVRHSRDGNERSLQAVGGSPAGQAPRFALSLVSEGRESVAAQQPSPMANPTAPTARSGINVHRPSTAVGVETRRQRKAKGKAEVSVSVAVASAASSAAIRERHPRHGEMGSMDSLKEADEAKQGEGDGEEEERARGSRRERKGSEDEGIPPAAMATSFRGGVSLQLATVEEVRAGKLEATHEFVGILDNGVIGGKVSRSQVVYIVNMGENLGIKKKGEQKKGKARMFVKGGRDIRPIDTYAGVPSLVGLNVSFVYMLGLDPPMQIHGVDVEKAFQQVDNENRDTHGAIGVRIPIGFPVLLTENPFPDRFTDKRWVELRQEAAVKLQPGSIHLLAKAHYGGRGSRNLFCGFFQREMQSLRSYEVVDESVLVKWKGAGRDGLKVIRAGAEVLFGEKTGGGDPFTKNLRREVQIFASLPEN
uniref:Uncharacterized protein n=1 Tax=Chromera velia CCMP2878 TaxID=1169474 RepID=A0A0G4HL19_9ALVE|eukprot:Cvel_7303.t1-p1 / transcript=Cvel_7303.t1 / gene=Cvel_7303 / organism=Chromera_velia_CCMP2878 / gene_product=hypothetical protein / transcript_product=hypothetical protein / location=Cvel_scaffold378:6090-12816(-) / protein_length=642 / sequence_SO=supercontig / SO=protein_coding / is_pseudo=false